MVDAYRSVRLTVGEIADRLTITQLKIQKLDERGIDTGTLRTSEAEFKDALTDLLDGDTPQFELLLNSLRTVNAKLWEIEDKCRDSVRYLSVFNDCAKQVMTYNAERSRLKAEINLLVTGSVLDEVKSYGSSQDA